MTMFVDQKDLSEQAARKMVAANVEAAPAKGFATALGGPEQPKVHRGYVQFLQQIKRRTELQFLCQCTPGQVTPYIDSLMLYARLIENLAPANANNGPSPEYPSKSRAE